MAGRFGVWAQAGDSPALRPGRSSICRLTNEAWACYFAFLFGINADIRQASSKHFYSRFKENARHRLRSPVDEDSLVPESHDAVGRSLDATDNACSALPLHVVGAYEVLAQLYIARYIS